MQYVVDDGGADDDVWSKIVGMPYRQRYAAGTMSMRASNEYNIRTYILANNAIVCIYFGWTIMKTVAAHLLTCIF